MEAMKCRAVHCGREATLILQVTVTSTSVPPFDDDIPYCDHDFGSFYRALTRPMTGPQIEIRGIEVIKEFGDPFDPNWTPE
jgi:hypothetical protein